METYNFENKQLYRERRETSIDRIIGTPKAIRKIAYLDTKEALDTISYLKRGYQAENLYAINRNPAEVALLTMKLKQLGLPKVNTIGLEFEEALNTRVPDVHIIDFDGMGNISNSLIGLLNRISSKRKNCVYGVTVMAGREVGVSPDHKPDPNYAYIKNEKWGNIIKLHGRHEDFTHTSFNTKVIANHMGRLFVILRHGLAGNINKLNEHVEDILKRECFTHINKLYWDVYTSISGQPMLWVICKLSEHKELTSNEVRKMRKETNEICLPICYYAKQEQIFFRNGGTKEMVLDGTMTYPLFKKIMDGRLTA